MLSYVARVRETVGGAFIDHDAVEVPVGAALTNGSSVATVTLDVPCPVANGAMSLLLTARDGAGNSRVTPVESDVWVRDTVPPSTTAVLAQPEAFFQLLPLNVSVTNASTVSVAVSSPFELPRGFSVAVTRTDDTASRRSSTFNVTGGTVDVELPWDGSLTLSVVRACQLYSPCLSPRSAVTCTCRRVCPSCRVTSLPCALLWFVPPPS